MCDLHPSNNLLIIFRMFGQHQTLDQQDLSIAHQPQTLDLSTVLHHLKVPFSDHPAKVCFTSIFDIYKQTYSAVTLFMGNLFVCQFFESFNYILTIQLVNSDQSTSGLIIAAVLCDFNLTSKII